MRPSNGPIRIESGSNFESCMASRSVPVPEAGARSITDALTSNARMASLLRGSCHVSFPHARDCATCEGRASPLLWIPRRFMRSPQRTARAAAAASTRIRDQPHGSGVQFRYASLKRSLRAAKWESRRPIAPDRAKHWSRSGRRDCWPVGSSKSRDHTLRPATLIGRSSPCTWRAEAESTGIASFRSGT